MKRSIHLFLILIFAFSSLFLFSQEKCKVLIPQIAGTYEGKCKNGFANGKGTATGTDRYEGYFIKGFPNGEGTYTWSTGEIYTGEWVKGMRHGIGKYTTNIEGKISVLYGVWQEDKYIGLKPPNPLLIYNSGVDRYDFRKNNTTMSRVLIDIFQNGNRNLGITNFMMSTSSGSDTKIGQSVGFEYIIFPVTIKIMYTTWNKIHTIQTNVKFEFEIFEPGDWTVTLNN